MASENGALVSKLTAPQREQMALMGDREMSWSATHGWPSLCESLSDKGLIEITARIPWGLSVGYRSVITDLGRKIRTQVAA